MSRTYKKQYYGAKRASKSCRCHGSCVYCRKGRLHAVVKAAVIAEETHLELDMSVVVKKRRIV